MPTDAQIEAHVSKFKEMSDTDFIRAAIRSARYLDKQSRAIAREALRRFDLLHPVGGEDKDDDFHCEGCGKAIKPGDKYTTTLDGCYLCEEDAPSFKDCVDQWNDRDDGTYDEEEKEAAEACREGLAAHIAAGGSPDDKPLTVME